MGISILNTKIQNKMKIFAFFAAVSAQSIYETTEDYYSSAVTGTTEPETEPVTEAPNATKRVDRVVRQINQLLKMHDEFDDDFKASAMDQAAELGDKLKAD